MEYDPGDSFPFDFKPDGNPFMVQNQEKNCRHDHTPFNSIGNGNLYF